MNISNGVSKKIKIIIPVVIFLLIFIVVGFFWWQRGKIENYFEQKETEKVFALAKDYKIYETPEGKFIENKKDGFRAKVPDEWRVEIGANMLGYADDMKVILGSSDFSYRPSRGCIIEMLISRVEKEREEFFLGVRSADEVKREIALIKETKNHFSDEEVILISGKESLKQISALNKGEHIIIETPSGEKVYLFDIIIFSEECKQTLNKFFETISIQ
jgi:hypothetical protein